jgi:multidrug resistance efflux pump
MRWLLLIIVTTAAGFLTGQLLWSNPAKQTDNQTTPAATAPAQARNQIQGIGYVEPASEVRKLMLRTGGVIKTCNVNVGDTVRQGATLLELDDATQKAEVEVARKNRDLARAEAVHISAGTNPYKLRVVEELIERCREKVRHYRNEAERSDRLVARNATSKQEHDTNTTLRRQAEIELREQEAELLHLQKSVTPAHQAMLEAKVRQAEAVLQLAEERARETRLLAPFDGTILKILKREGEGIRQFEPEPVILFGDLSRVRVRAEIDERFVQDLHAGQKAEVYGRNLLGKCYLGKICEIERIMGDKTVFTRASSERKNLDVLQVVIEMEGGFTAPVGLQVDVRIQGTLH